MTTVRRNRPAADVAVGYAADERGTGIAYAAIATGSATSVARLRFAATHRPALDGRDTGYAAVAAVATALRQRGFGRVRIRLADDAVVAELSGAAQPPKALAMEYVKARCLLHGFSALRIETADPVETRDLTRRARADLSLHAAA